MTSTIGLCIDAASARHPEMIGLAGENLMTQEWLHLFTSAVEARRFLHDDTTIDEVWVAGSDDVEPINLAAALKRDRAERRVCLIAFQGSGSLKSRATAAGIDASLTRQAFTELYAHAKRQRRTVSVTETASKNRPMIGDLGGPRPQTDKRSSAVRKRTDGARTSNGCAPSRQQPRSAVRFEPAPTAPSVAVASDKSAFIMPIVSGSGGAGKSTIAALSALFARRFGYETLLLDFDLRFGDMRELLGVSEALTIDDVIAAPARLSQLKCDGPRPALLAAPRRLEDAEAIVRDAPRLLDELQRRFDIIIANTGAAWEEEHALLLERSSKAFFMIDQRASSLRACRHALDLCVRCGIATGPFLFAVNRCSKGSLLTSLDASCALRGARSIELRDGGRDVEDIMGAGLSLDLIASKNDLCTSLEQTLLDVLPGCESRSMTAAEPQAKVSPRMFGRGRRRKKRGVACLCSNE